MLPEALEGSPILVSAAAAAAAGTIACTLWSAFGPPVSYPGGPRPRRLHRKPRWASTRAGGEARERLAAGWVFESAEASHAVTRLGPRDIDAASLCRDARSAVSLKHLPCLHF